MVEIIGQNGALEVLSSTLRSKRLSGAYLFVGPPGVGKFTTARLIAAALLCRSGKFPPCGECISCRKVEHLNHPDVIYLEPRGAEIRIDDVRETNRLLLLKPFESDYKVAIVDSAEKFRREAANAMLKTLEEPPTNTVIILVAASTAALLPTIVSRSQIIRFNALDDETLAAWLKKKRNLTEDDARFLAKLASGSPGKADAMIRNRKLEDLKEQVEKLLNGLLGGTKSRLELAKDISGKRDELAENIEFILMLCNMKLNESQTDGERDIWRKRTEIVLSTERKLRFNPALQLAAEAMLLQMP
ncbi:MAG: hypothetical protein Kow0090_16330 [Myxococcota bacterium]